MRGRWVGCFAALLAAAGPCLAVAQSERAEATLVYERAPGAEMCPGSQALEDAVAARLGYFPFRLGAARAVVVRIARHRETLRADIELREPGGRVSGRRQIDTPSADCRELVASVAVAISLGLDPLSLGRPPPSASVSASASAVAAEPTASSLASAPPPPPSAPAPSASAPPPPVVSSAPPSLPPPVPPERTPWHLRASLGPRIWSGTAPELAPGLGAEIALRHGLLGIGVEGRSDLSTTAQGGNVEVTSSISAVGLVLCLHRGLVLGCLLGQLGSLEAKGRGLDEPQQDRSLYSAVGARAGLELGLGSSLFVRPHLDALAPLRRATFLVDRRPVWTSPALSIAVGLALGLDFF